jgi:hypothetical protein
LDLEVSWPAAEGTLEAIASRRLPIKQLFVHKAISWLINWHPFKGLNLDSLECVSLHNLENSEIESLLDLSLNSKCQELDLRFMEYYEVPSPTSFAHKLLKRVRTMTFEACE